jgi:regulator of protease activity HflC (stomatin/prohibitin superfamily)
MSDSIFGERWFQAIVVLVIAGVVAFGAFFTCTYGIGLSNAGLLIDPWGKTVSDPIVGPVAFSLKAPWQDVRTFYLGTQTIDMWTDIVDETKIGDYPTVHCNSKDGLWIDVDLTIRFHLIPSSVKELYLNYTSLDWKEKTVAPVMRRAVRDAIANFTAIEVIEKRGIIAVQLRDLLQGILDEQASLGKAISIEGVDLRDIWLAEEFQSAVNSKLAAEQNMIGAQFNATQIVIIANATAQAQVRQAYGIAESNLIIANATSESIRMIAEATGMNSSEVGRIYLQMTLLKEIAERNPNMKFIILIGNQESPTYLIPID